MYLNHECKPHTKLQKIRNSGPPNVNSKYHEFHKTFSNKRTSNLVESEPIWSWKYDMPDCTVISFLEWSY